jgi:hypothetical protein
VNFEPCALARRIVLGSPQGDDRVEHVFSTRRPPLPTVGPGVVDKEGSG